MKVKQTLRAKLYLLSSLFLVSAFTGALLQPSQPVSALNSTECINTYGALLGGGATIDDVNRMKADGCEAPDGPCTAVKEVLPEGAYSIFCSGPEDAPKLTKQQCIAKYHKNSDPSSARLALMSANNCKKPKGPCVLVTMPLRLIDCKDAYSDVGLSCAEYTNAAENAACRDGYANGVEACDGLTGKKKTACEHGASSNTSIEPEPIGGDDCGGVETAIIKCDANNEGGIENNGVWALLLMAINILTAGIGIAAIGGIVYGSILYTTAGDNESQIKSAKEIIRNVVVGLVAYIGMFALLQFIIPGGVFS